MFKLTKVTFYSIRPRSRGLSCSTWRTAGTNSRHRSRTWIEHDTSGSHCQRLRHSSEHGRDDDPAVADHRGRLLSHHRRVYNYIFRTGKNTARISNRLAYAGFLTFGLCVLLFLVIVEEGKPSHS